MFSLLSSAETNILFNNKITESDSLNGLNFSYLYHGAGIGVIDVNNDGLKDLYFAGNMVSGKLYLNKGNLKFEDITEASGLSTSVWVNGVSIVDINQDGRQDIYLNVSDRRAGLKGSNLLYINNGPDKKGIPQFTEQAQSYGLADPGYTMQTAFFDYDNDGDLDAYLLTNGRDSGRENNSPRAKKINGENPNTDRLYRNEGLGPKGHVVFKDVSREAGILIEGYGLGVGVLDVNNDGWPDIYVANDFISNDLLWQNNGNGTFTNKIGEYLKHQSYNGMGVDIADINNDGLEEIMVADMLPETNSRKKMMFSGSNYSRFQLGLAHDYQPQYVRNTLQLNRGIIPGKGARFSEIGQLAGVHQTDWSWAPLFADFDNDGYKDLFITNGYKRDVTDLDFIVYDYNSLMFGSKEYKEKAITDKFNSLPQIKLDNYIYRNKADLTFEDKSEAWGIKTASFSNGSIYADLDNDGDLDIVTNNIDDPAFIYRNNLSDLETKGHNHFLNIKLVGSKSSVMGLGTTIKVYSKGNFQYYRHTIYRGYLSSVQQEIHFGMGKEVRADSVEIVWPDKKYQLLKNSKSDTTVMVYHTDAKFIPQKPKSRNSRVKQPFLREVNDSITAPVVHKEYDYNDFDRQILLMHKFSEEGPGIAVGDVNNDALDDFYLGGSREVPGTLYLQQKSGGFRAIDFKGERTGEDIGALIFDANNDGNNDLYVVRGSNEFNKGDDHYQDLLYINDGKGNLTVDTGALPIIKSNGSCVRAADYDRDGDLDLFVGGSIEPGNYPIADKSYLLENVAGRFKDVTNKVAKGLSTTGIVKDALWSDFDQDGWVDLILVGEWMPPQFWKNDNGIFKNSTAGMEMKDSSGWWNSINSGDFNQDGKIDYVLGNMGLNSQYKASPGEPIRLYAEDMDANGTRDPILVYYIKNDAGKKMPYVAHTRDQLAAQMPSIKKKFSRYRYFAQATLEEVLPNNANLPFWEVNCLKSSVFLNRGGGHFERRDLPLEAQISPIYGIVVSDINNDTYPDIVTVGNSYAPEVQNGRDDAGIGTILLGDGQGNFKVETKNTGFFVDGNAKGLAFLQGKNKERKLIATVNNGPVKLFEVEEKSRNTLYLEPNDCRVEISYGGPERKEIMELYYGNGYLSQSSRFIDLPLAAKSVIIHKFDGTSRQVDF